MDLFNFIRSIEAALPPDAGMQGDRIGLQLQSGRQQIHHVMITMEVTDAVVDEAVEAGADCIVAFHPLIFRPLSVLQNSERVGRLCTRLIRQEIALIVAHTNFDAHSRGTSALLAERLELQVKSFLRPDPNREDFGMGIVAAADPALSPRSLLERIAAICHAPLRYTEGKASELKTIAIVGGSGISFLDDVLQAGADAFITADIKYHDFHRVKGDLMLIDPGHYEMEQFVPQGLAAILKNIAERSDSSLRLSTSAVLPNPVRYFPDTAGYSRAQQRLLKVSQ